MPSESVTISVDIFLGHAFTKIRWVEEPEEMYHNCNRFLNGRTVGGNFSLELPVVPEQGDPQPEEDGQAGGEAEAGAHLQGEYLRPPPLRLPSRATSTVSVCSAPVSLLTCIMEGRRRRRESWLAMLSGSSVLVSNQNTGNITSGSVCIKKYKKKYKNKKKVYK